MPELPVPGIFAARSDCSEVEPPNFNNRINAMDDNADKITPSEIDALLNQIGQGSVEKTQPALENDFSTGTTETNSLPDGESDTSGLTGRVSGTTPNNTTSGPPGPGSELLAIQAEDTEAMMDHAQAALDSIENPSQAATLGAAYTFSNLTDTPTTVDTASLQLVQDVELELKIELGRTQMCLEDVMRLAKGAVVKLDKLAGDHVDVMVNGRLVARGEVLVLNDNFCVRVTELIEGGKSPAAS
jgi:flagellar motor switch protein FliN/FliY